MKIYYIKNDSCKQIKLPKMSEMALIPPSFMRLYYVLDREAQLIVIAICILAGIYAAQSVYLGIKKSREEQREAELERWNKKKKHEAMLLEKYGKHVEQADTTKLL